MRHVHAPSATRKQMEESYQKRRYRQISTHIPCSWHIFMPLRSHLQNEASHSTPKLAETPSFTPLYLHMHFQTHRCHGQKPACSDTVEMTGQPTLSPWNKHKSKVHLSRQTHGEEDSRHLCLPEGKLLHLLVWHTPLEIQGELRSKIKGFT